jgi:demethylmenaquinone methyltransferase / 2-methoxy-6-polyprenyl-1,4-benzoquinol methylase
MMVPSSFSENVEASVDFGFEQVSPAEKTERVHGVFSSVASRYDVMNDIMSGGLHRLWKDHFVAQVKLPEAESTILDLAGGTGDIAFRMHRAFPEARVMVSDIHPAMLEVGKRRAIDKGLVSRLSWLEVNAESIPLADNSVDAVTIAFGMRNVTHREQALREIFRVLKPYGQFLCLEFCPVAQPVISPFYHAYLRYILPVMGQVVARDAASYRYLAESIQRFPTADRYASMIEAAGFQGVSYELLGAGMVAIHTGWRGI